MIWIFLAFFAGAILENMTERHRLQARRRKAWTIFYYRKYFPQHSNCKSELLKPPIQMIYEATGVKTCPHGEPYEAWKDCFLCRHNIGVLE